MRAMSTRTLDYGSKTPFSGVFGQPKHLAWPVNAYRVTIPAALSVGGDLVNPFERVILKVIDAVGGLDERALADETCIPVDLVRSVTLRLRDKGLINDDNLIIDQQRKTWEEDGREEDYTSALIFRELVGGRILPFVHVLDASNPLKTKIAKRGIRRLWQDDRYRHLPPPTTRNVINAITQMRKRTAAYAQTTRIPTIEQIRVGRQPEEYLLDSQIAIQSRDADFRIADPFGSGFSRILEDTFNRRLEADESLQEWMTSWRRSLSSPVLRDDEVRDRRPFDTEENRRRYPKLVLALIPPRGAQHRSIEDIYASLEWALFYTCEANRPDIAIRRLKQESGQHFSERMSRVATSIGFEASKFGFRPIPEGKFIDYSNQSAEMDSVLAIALVQAETNPAHPLRSVAETYPDFMDRLSNLRTDRGNRAHGQRVTEPRGAELESDPFMREVVSTLLPSMHFDSNAPRAAELSLADLRLDARTSLLDAFGYQTFNRLGPSAQESLLGAEQFWLVSQDGDDARGFISNLYSALQGVLREFVGRVAALGFPESDYKTQASINAELAGLGSLPRAFTSVRPARIRDTLQGDDRSLGALVISILLVTSEVRLKELANAQPDFLTAIADIVDRRGHGNQPAPMQRAEAKNLRASTIATLITLLELDQED